MKLSNVWIVYHKELIDMLRDRRTMIAMVVFPIVIFPVMTIGFGNLAESTAKKAQQQASKVMLLGEEHAPELAARLRQSVGIEVASAAADYVQQISDKKLRAAVEFPAGFEQALKSEAKEPPTVQIYYYTGELRSEAAARRIEDAVREYRDGIVQQRLTARQLSPAILKPVEPRRQNVAAAEKVGGLRLAAIIPYFIIILCISGAMHPAMDLTAGEKERGTLETILVSAVSRRELVVGKFLLVLTTSLVTAVLSLASYLATMQFASTAAMELTRGYNFTISGKAMAALFLLVLPMAILFSATLVAISTFAKSYKEAQSYLGPLMFVVIVPAIVSMLPGIELSAKLALVPILNQALVLREVLTGNYPWGSIVFVFASTCVYAAIALAAAVHMFNREDVLFRA